MRKNIILAIILLLVISSLNCISNQDNQNNNEKEKIICRYWYQIEINYTSSNYDINVPIPVYSDNQRIIYISSIAEDLKVAYGIAFFNIENTSFGPSLRINGTGHVIINISGNDLEKFLVNNKYKKLFLSLAIDENNDGFYDDESGKLKYNIYCHQNITLDISINFHYRKYNKSFSKTLIDIDSEINQGWNIINGTYYIVA